MNYTKCFECGFFLFLSNIFVFIVRGFNSFCMVYRFLRLWGFFRVFFYMLYYNVDKMDDLNFRYLVKLFILNLFFYLLGVFILRYLFMLYVFELYYE